jgi:hypothetical protein
MKLERKDVTERKTGNMEEINKTKVLKEDRVISIKFLQVNKRYCMESLKVSFAGGCSL